MKKIPAITILVVLAAAVSFAQGEEIEPDLRSEQKMDTGLLQKLPDEVMRDEHLRVKLDPVQRAASHSMARKGTTPDWRQGLPLGNGDMGAIMHGLPDNLTFHLGKNDIWWHNVPTDLNFLGGISLEEFRQRLRAGDATVRDDLGAAAAKQLQANSVIASQTGAGRFTLQLCRSASFYRVRERLDLDRAVATTSFGAAQHDAAGWEGGGQVESFLSLVDEVMVIRATPLHTSWQTGEQQATPEATWHTVRFELSRDPMELPALLGGGVHAEMTEEELDRRYQPQPHCEGNRAWFRMALSGGDGYVVMLGTDLPEVTLAAVGPDLIGRGRAPAGPVTFYLAIVSTYDSADPVAEARARLDRAQGLGYEQLLARHERWWRAFWQRSWVALPDPAQERPWYWSLYVAASARHPGKTCPAYAAPWQASNYPSWGCHLLTFEEPRACLGFTATNHAELLEPFVALLNRARGPLREFTQRQWGLPGVFYPHCISSRGYPTQMDTHHFPLMLNPQCSGECVKYAWDYYDFTGDVDFLREVGYPLLRDVATFYRAYLQEDAQGRLIIFPSRFFEYLSPPAPALGDYMTNSVTDLAMFRLVFRQAIAAAEILGVDAAQVADWRDALARLAPYATYPSGVWRPAESWTGPETGGPEGHITSEFSRLYPVALGDEVDAWHGPEELRRQARATYEAMLGAHQGAWDGSFSYIAAARMGDRDYAAKILNWLGGGPGALNAELSDSPYHCDSAAAVSAEIITEFLLQSQGGDIRLFPAVPLSGNYAFHSLRARGAFLVSSELRDGQVPYVLIQSLAGNACRVTQPFGDGLTVTVRDLDTDEVVLTREVAADEVVEFPTVAGHLYTLERSDQPLEQVPVIKE